MIDSFRPRILAVEDSVLEDSNVEDSDVEDSAAEAGHAPEHQWCCVTVTRK